MSTEQLAIRQNDLLNRLVIDRETAEEVGRVEQLWLDPKAHQVLGFSCKSGIFGGTKRTFTWAQIQSIGTDSIVVNLPPAGADSPKPEQVIPLIGHEVFTEAGNKAGKLVDYLLIHQTGTAATVVNYLYSSSGWRGILDGIYLLAPESITKIGSKRVMVADAAVQTPQKYAEGLTQIIKEDYQKSKRDLETFKRTTQNFAEQAKEKAQNFAEQAKDRAQTAAEKAKESAQNFAEQAKERAQTATEKAKEGAQNFAEQAKDRAQTAAEKAKEGAQNLAERAKETTQSMTEKTKATISDLKTTRPNPPAPADTDIVEEITVEPPSTEGDIL